MEQRIYVAGYWGPREEPADACAGRLERWLTSLRRAHPALDNWDGDGELASGHPEADGSARALAHRLVAEGVTRGDESGAVMPELGFSGALWNGDEQVSAEVSFICGSWSPYAGLNAAVLTLPPAGAPGAQILYELTLVRDLVELTAETWQADWVVATSDELRAARAWLPRQPIVGWLTYLSPARCPSSGLTVGKITRTSGGGRILQLASQWHGITPELIEAAADELAREGCLQPIQ